MLITRCPECETSFRITVEQLHKADGQVRCGQCAAIFSAFDSLSDTASDREFEASGAAAAPQSDDASAHEDDVAATAEPEDEPSDDEDHVEGFDELIATAEAMEAADATDMAPPAETIEAHEAAEIAYAGPSAETNDLSADDAAAIPDSEVDQVLEVSRNEFIPPWLPQQIAQPREREPAAWRVAAAVALLALAGQAVHHFRGTLVQQAYVGPALAGLYTKLGFPIEPAWDPTAFEIEARMATAQAAADAESSLDITAGIRNVSGKPLPYPIIHLQLTDRWEKALGTRMFESSEYLPSNSSRRAVLRPGASADITLKLVDPGPDAYGFQVDVCVPAGRGTVRCKADAVFD